MITDNENGKDNQPVPPGAPDRHPVKVPGPKESPKGDPQSPEEKKPRL